MTLVKYNNKQYAPKYGGYYMIIRGFTPATRT